MAFYKKILFYCIYCILIVSCGPNIKKVNTEDLVNEQYSSGDFQVNMWLMKNPDKPRIIYIHGTPGDSEGWNSYLVDPVMNWEAIAIDRPGFGNTTPTQSVPSLKMQGEAIYPLLEEREGIFPILVGHSLGGPIIARVAADYPRKVGGIVIIAGNLDPKLEELHWYNYLIRPFEWLIPRMLENSNQELWDLQQELEELEKILDKIKIPILIIHGKDDALVPYENVDFMMKAFKNNPNLTIIPVEKQGHFVIWDQEQLVRDSIVEMIKSI